jgi:hypothetical protein
MPNAKCQSKMMNLPAGRQVPGMTGNAGIRNSWHREFLALLAFVIPWHYWHSSFIIWHFAFGILYSAFSI